jgi:hypothetical protein
MDNENEVLLVLLLYVYILQYSQLNFLSIIMFLCWVLILWVQFEYLDENNNVIWCGKCFFFSIHVLTVVLGLQSMKSTVFFCFWTLSLFNDDLNTRPELVLCLVLVCLLFSQWLFELTLSLNALSPTYSQFIHTIEHLCRQYSKMLRWHSILQYRHYNSMTRQLKGLKGEESTEQYEGLWMRRFKNMPLTERAANNVFRV